MANQDEYEDDFEDYEEDFEPEDPPAYAPVANGAPPKPQFSRSPSMSFPWALVTLDELDMGDKLAAGAMGAVHAGFYRGRPVAIKTLHDTSREQMAKVEAELLVHASLRAPRTVELLGANLIPPRCCIVMERCECSLFERLHRHAGELSRRQSVTLALQVAEGMKYLHTRRPAVVHRDLKSHNVLIDERGEAKLCDFGLVNTREATAGTPNYMAPELFQGKPFSAAVDVFAFGVLLNEMWAREVPWDGYQPLDIKQKVEKGERPPIARTMPYACEGLVKKLWHGTPALRPSMADALVALDGVLDTLPGDSLSRSLPLDSLDSDALDCLTNLTLNKSMPRPSSRR